MNAIEKTFELGQLVISPAAREALSSLEICAALERHTAGDWGEVCPKDWQANDDALEHGARLLSVYSNAAGLKFWVITEANRAITTVFLAESY